MSEVPLYGGPVDHSCMGHSLDLGVVRSVETSLSGMPPPRGEAFSYEGATHVEGYLAHKKTHPLGPYRRTMPRVIGGSYGVSVSL